MDLTSNPFGRIPLQPQKADRKHKIYVLEVNSPNAEQQETVEEITYNDFGIITTPVKKTD